MINAVQNLWIRNTNKVDGEYEAKYNNILRPRLSLSWLWPGHSRPQLILDLACCWSHLPNLGNTDFTSLTFPNSTIRLCILRRSHFISTLVPSSMTAVSTSFWRSCVCYPVIACPLPLEFLTSIQYWISNSCLPFMDCESVREPWSTTGLPFSILWLPICHPLNIQSLFSAEDPILVLLSWIVGRQWLNLLLHKPYKRIKLKAQIAATKLQILQDQVWFQGQDLQMRRNGFRLRYPSWLLQGPTTAGLWGRVGRWLLEVWSWLSRCLGAGTGTLVSYLVWGISGRTRVMVCWTINLDKMYQPDR